MAILTTVSFLAALLAAVANHRLAASHVAIGIDSSVGFASTPVAVWGDSEADREVFEAVDRRYSPVQPFFELIPAAQKHPDSTGHHIWLAQNPKIERYLEGRLEKRFHPFDLGQRYLWYQINDESREGPYVWHRDGDTPTLVFLKTPSSGMVRFKTPSGESILDLYSPHEEVVEVAEDELTAARYYATVPRRALADLKIEFPDTSGATIHRLYIGTLWPRLFFSGAYAYPKNAKSGILGEIKTHAALDVSDGVIALSLAPFEQGGVVSFVALFILVWTLLASMILCVMILVWLLRRALADDCAPVPPIGPFHAGRFLGYFAAFCMVFLFYLGCTWPGIMSPDSVKQWEQAHTWELTDDHPALHTLSYKLIASVWDNPAAIALVQVFGMSLVLAYAYSLLLRAGVPVWITSIMFHIALLSPKNGILSVTLWKDVPFSVLVLLSSTLLLRLCFQRNGKLDIVYWIGLGITLGLLPLVRHNGLIILLGIAPILPLVFWRWRYRALLFGTALSLTLFATVKYGVYPALDVKGWQGLNSYLYTVKSAILIDQDVPLANETYEFLDGVRDIGTDRWAFDAHTGNTTVNGAYDFDYAIANEAQYKPLFNSMALRYPLLLAQDHLMRSDYVFSLAHPESHKLSRNHYLSLPKNNDRTQEMGYTNRPLFPKLSRILGDLITVTQEGSCVLLRPALCLYAVLASLLLLAIRMRVPRYLVAYLPALLSTVSVLIIPIATQIRYQFPLTLTAGFLFCLMFMAKPKCDTGTDNDESRTLELGK